MPYYYSHTREPTCTCCALPAVEFDSEEGRNRRRQLVRRYGRASAMQLLVALVASVSGATTIGLAADNPSFAFMSCFPLLNGILMLIGAVLGVVAGRANLDTQYPPAIKRCLMVYSVFCFVGFAVSPFAIGFAGMCLGYCLAPADSYAREDCLPRRDLRLSFVIIDFVTGLLLLVFCIVGSVLYCVYLHYLGLPNRLQTLGEEMATLRAQVAVLSQNQQAGGAGPPPAYGVQPSAPGWPGGYQSYYGQAGQGFTFSNTGEGLGQK